MRAGGSSPRLSEGGRKEGGRERGNEGGNRSQKCYLDETCTHLGRQEALCQLIGAGWAVWLGGVWREGPPSSPPVSLAGQETLLAPRPWVPHMCKTLVGRLWVGERGDGLPQSGACADCRRGPGGVKGPSRRCMRPGSETLGLPGRTHGHEGAGPVVQCP